MTKIGLIQFLLLFLISAAWGQKVKYKDIYALLSTKQYEQAEPFLRRYLRENADDPNAHLFMGNIFREKAMNNDVLRQTETAIANMDSAILHFDTARAMLDEKEVRKNKEYYEAYNRRDLRTGEFGVKLSDIQFDLEKKAEALRERIGSVKMVKHYFVIADTAYRDAQKLFNSLQQRFPAARHLYLRADEQTLKDLVSLSLTFDTCITALQHYKSAAANLGKVPYTQQVSLAEITDFKTQGATPADLFQEAVTLWDYKKFADEARAIIEKEILPLREDLASHDKELNKLRDNLGKDSTSVRNALSSLANESLYDRLKRFDDEPLPLLLFSLKVTDLQYRSALLEHAPLRDSADVHLQVAMIRDELKLLLRMDSVASLLSADKVDRQAADYATFIAGAYGDAEVLKNYLSAIRAFNAAEQQSRSTALRTQLTALNYIVDGADSIPLLPEFAGVYRPLATSPEKFTVGLTLRDSTDLHGYFYTITASRLPDVKAYFPLNKAAITAANVGDIRALTSTDGGEQIYYVLICPGQAVGQKFPATLAKIYRSDGLAWRIDLPLSFAPSQLLLTADTGEVVISDDGQQTVVDKNGKVVL